MSADDAQKLIAVLMETLSKSSSSEEDFKDPKFKQGVNYCINKLKEEREEIVNSSIILKKKGVKNV